MVVSRVAILVTGSNLLKGTYHPTSSCPRTFKRGPSEGDEGQLGLSPKPRNEKEALVGLMGLYRGKLNPNTRGEHGFLVAELIIRPKKCTLSVL